MDTLLQVMICTHGRDGLSRVAAMALPALDGVAYLVSCQSATMPLPAALSRQDVDVAFTDSTGLSNNRNAALARVTAPYALVCDDDVTLLPDGLRAIINTFEANPDLDIAAFRFIGADKPYPPAVRDIADNYRGYTVSSIELAMRTDAVRRAALAFSPLMGLGAPVLHSGEENVFILNAQRRGLRCRFFPIDIARHPAPTSTAVPTPGVLRSQGAYIILAHPWTAPLRLILTAWRRPAPLLANLRHLLSGARYALRHRRALRP